LKWVIVGMALLYSGFGFADTCLAASLKYPESISIDESQQFIDRFSNEDYIYLRNWTGYKLKYVAKDKIGRAHV